MKDRLVFIGGDTTAGKSFSLRGIKDPSKTLYLACEGKGLPFSFPKDSPKFKTLKVTDPYQVPQAITQIANDPSIETVIIDTVDYLMNMFQAKYVEGVDGFSGWAAYKAFIMDLFLQTIPNTTGKTFLVLAHTKFKYSDTAQAFEAKIPVKGAVEKEGGLEGYTNCLVMAKVVDVDLLKKHPNKYLTITAEEEEDGYKYVFQTRKTKETKAEQIRSIHGMFERNELYIDNNAQHLIDALNELYA